MKTLILTTFLTLTMNAFAEQNHDIDCAALSESTERVSKNLSESATKEESKEVSVTAK
jgi:hypothetical protein